jgi:hypothetical protein
MQQKSQLTTVGRSTEGLPRTYRLEREGSPSRRLDPARSAAYRRLTAAILGLDVATLGSHLRARRLQRSEFLVAA